MGINTLLREIKEGLDILHQDNIHMLNSMTNTSTNEVKMIKPIVEQQQMSQEELRKNT